MMLPGDSETRRESISEMHGYSGPLATPREEMLVAELWRMFRTRWQVIAGCTAACLLIAGLYVLLRNPRYEAAAQIEVSPLGTNSMGLEESTTRTARPLDAATELQSAVTVLQSKTVALAVIQQTGLAERADFAGSWVQPANTDVAHLPPKLRDHLLRRFQQNLKVGIVPKTDIVAVQFRSGDARKAAEVANAVVSCYTERNFRSSYEAATRVSGWLSSQMEDLKLKANEAQEKLAALQQQRGLIGADESNNTITNKLKDLNEQLALAESDRIAKEARYRIAASADPDLIASTVPEPTLQVLRSQQAELHVDLARLSTKFGEGYPKLAEVRNQLAQVDGAIDAELKRLSERYKNDYVAAANAEKMLQARYGEQERKAYQLNQGASQYAILKREVQTTQDLYQTLQGKLNQAGIVAGLASANISVVEPASVPSEPVDPRPGVDLALGLGCGIAAGILTVLGLEALDSTIRNAEEAQCVTALPILGEIPEARKPHRGPRRQAALRHAETRARLVAHHSPQSSLAEAYRCLRTSLLQGDGSSPRILAVTSCLPSEGKTTTAINCAVVLAQQGRKVLLVDADLRGSSVHEAFGLAQDPGLTGILSRVCTAEEALRPTELMPNLTVLPAGVASPFPAEMLASPQMNSLLEHWRMHYDHIVVDTPPTSRFADAVIVGSQADATLLVARSGRTTKFALRHARDQMLRANVNIAGVVLNRVDKTYESSYYHRYGYGLTARSAKLLDS